MKPKVLIITTGGTIAESQDVEQIRDINVARFDPSRGRLVTAFGGDELVAGLPGIDEIAEFQVEQFAAVDSFQITLQIAFDIARRIDEVLMDPAVCGAVVTHGTDTMEESAFIADLLVSSDKPVVFTGAQIPGGDGDSDGPQNLLDSIRVAVSTEAKGLGALVCFNGELHAARDVSKTHTTAVQTFQSYGHGPLGVVDGHRVVIHRRPVRRCHLSVSQPEKLVDLVRISIDVDGSQIDAAVSNCRKGLVIEGFGLGNVPAVVVDSVRRAIAAGVVVVVVSRCLSGRVTPIYAAEGCGKDLADAGAIFAGDLAGVKARVLLMLALADPVARDNLAAVIAAVAP